LHLFYSFLAKRPNYKVLQNAIQITVSLQNDLSLHNLTYEDAIEMALDKPLWGLLAASGATHWWCLPNNDDDDDYKMKYSKNAYVVYVY